MIRDYILKNRSYRRFDGAHPISADTLREFVDLARLSGSGANRQPLKYILSCTPESNAKIYATLAWAGYLRDWDGPVEGERPTGYILLLGDKKISQSFGIDPGIAAQSILLGAVERGLGGCMVASVKREALIEALGLGEEYEILLVIALGKPVEQVYLEPLPNDGDIKYWRDPSGGHHVPKRALDEVILAEI